MKIEIEITEEQAACLFADYWGIRGGRSVQDIVQGLAVGSADAFRRSFPDALDAAVAEYREYRADQLKAEVALP